MAMDVRRLTQDDAEIFREIRLEALERHPETFQATYESAAELPLDAFRQRLRQYALFGGFVDGALCGFVGFYPLRNPKISHKGLMWGMYVTEAARGTGLAAAMVEAVVDHAKDKVEQILLSVIEDNERARQFYGKMGFEPYGMELRALKIGERYYNEEFRVKFLGGSSA
ncbi:GNAT family N-acetyltransferase [Pelagibius sp.]|uniref:GNAT family N-acetyltransferase n=1 Tax=Pelagibius sp. TaxID=1931238 RepID=UPI0026398567|nr:GNAT family N-acetyltransferase [Pelagibius sp.]